MASFWRSKKERAVLSLAAAEKDTGEWQIAALFLTRTVSGTPESHLEPLRRAQ